MELAEVPFIRLRFQNDLAARMTLARTELNNGDAGRGFITDGDTGQVTMFDLKTLKILGQIKCR